MKHFYDIISSKQRELLLCGSDEDFDQFVIDNFDDLFEFYLSTGDMPYGTAKARDGDPYIWINDRLLNDLRTNQYELYGL